MQEAVFIRRLSRFVCEVSVSGETVPVHLANTGRLLFLREGARCLLRCAASPKRATAWDLYAAEDAGVWVCVDSLAPNRIAAELLETELREAWPGVPLRSEVTLGESRLDFAAQLPDRLLAVEVKGSIMVRRGTAYFPDAPSVRAVRHLEHLRALALSGADARILFVVCRPDALRFAPEGTIDPAFRDAFLRARRSGVRADCAVCRMEGERLTPLGFIPVTDGTETVPGKRRSSP